MAVSERRDRRILSLPLVAFVTIPAVFTVYSLLLGVNTGGDGYSIDASRVQFALALIALGEIGVVSVVGWRSKLRLTSVAGVLLLVLLPVVFRITPGESKAATGYILLGLVAVLFVAGLELPVRHGEPMAELLYSDIGVSATATGVVHVLLAVGLEVVARGTVGISPFVLAAGLVSICILFVTSASAVILWHHEGLLSPAGTLLLWFTVGAYQTVTLSLSSGPLTASTGIDWSRFAPGPDYLFSAGVLIVVFLFVTGAEITYNKLRAATRTRAAG